MTTVSYTPSCYEAAQAQRACMKYRPEYGLGSGRYYIWAANICLILFVFYATSMLYPALRDMVETSLGRSATRWLLFAVVVGISVLLFWLLNAKIVPPIVLRRIAAHKPPNPVSMTLRDGLLEWEAAGDGHWVRVAAIERLFVLKGIVGMCVGSTIYYFPKRAFGSDNEFADFLKEVWNLLPREAQAASRGDTALSSIVD